MLEREIVIAFRAIVGVFIFLLWLKYIVYFRFNRRNNSSGDKKFVHYGKLGTLIWATFCLAFASISFEPMLLDPADELAIFFFPISFLTGCYFGLSHIRYKVELNGTTVFYRTLLKRAETFDLNDITHIVEQERYYNRYQSATLTDIEFYANDKLLFKAGEFSLVAIELMSRLEQKEYSHIIRTRQDEGPPLHVQKEHKQ